MARKMKIQSSERIAEELATLQSENSEIEQQINQASGALQETLRRAKKAFGVVTEKELTAMLQSMGTKADKAFQEFSEALEQYKEQWEVLEEEEEDD